MDNRDGIREFLTSRRGRITPAQAGLPAYGGNRRVPGLRREEAAMLAGVSVDYYTRLERGNLGGVSESVLHAVARALHLDEAESAHLFDLARAANTRARAPRRRRVGDGVRPSLRRILDGMTESPAFVRNGRLEVLAANQLATTLYRPAFESPGRPANLARFAFLDSRAVDFYPDWDDAANTTIALLRTEACRDPYDKDLSDLVGELSTRSDQFRVRWATHDVRLHHNGVKRFHHPVVGDLELAFEAMPLPSDPGLTLTAYSAEPGSASHDGVKLLASWAATLDPAAVDLHQL